MTYEEYRTLAADNARLSYTMMDSELADVYAYVSAAMQREEEDEGWTEVYDSPLRHTLHNAHVTDYIEYACNSDIPF